MVYIVIGVLFALNVVLTVLLTHNLRCSIKKLEKGIVPDYEEAKKAADAVNDFSKGISGIINYDPFIALHKDEVKE